LTDFKNLNFLSFAFNLIQKIDLVNLILSLKNIKILDFSHNYLTNINKKKNLDSNINKNLLGKIEYLDISFNHLQNFAEIVKIIRSSASLMNKGLFENFFCISIIGNPFSKKILKYLSNRNFNILNFIFNKSLFDSKFNNILTNNHKLITSKDLISKVDEEDLSYYLYTEFFKYIKNENFNSKYLTNFENVIKDIEVIIEEENYEKLNEDKNSLEKNSKKSFQIKNNYINENPINSASDEIYFSTDMDNKMLKCSLIEDLKQFNLIYENFSFSNAYRNFNEKNYFLEKVDKENSLKVLLLLKKKLLFIPKIIIPDNTNEEPINCFTQEGNFSDVNTLTSEITIVDMNEKGILSPSTRSPVKYNILKKNSEKKISQKILNLNNIHILYLSFNKISNLNNLNQFTELTELYLQSNKIKYFPTFEMKTLKKLDLSNNYIKSLQGISNIKNLHNLLVENNKITSLLLSELIFLSQLKEFNISGNHIESLKECINLRKIESIHNLDLSGNEVSNYSDFRIFIIYYLPNLKILNRYPVEKSEVLQAREFFDGRITSELLESKLGHTQTKNVRELDLSNNKLKSFERIFNNENFPNLRKLDLSRNSFSSFKIFGNLPSLIILYLNSNIFYSIIDPREKTVSTKGLLSIIVYLIFNFII